LCGRVFIKTISKIWKMKQRILLLAITLVGFTSLRASDPGTGGPNIGKKDDLNGTVVSADNKKPLEGVTVTAVFAAKKEKVIQTEEDGTYAFDELKPGTYKFIFEKAGFKKITKEKIIVKTDEAFQMNIEMIENSSIEVMPSPLHFSDFR
jgi:hypothetical protein